MLGSVRIRYYCETTNRYYTRKPDRVEKRGYRDYPSGSYGEWDVYIVKCSCGQEHEVEK